MIQSQSQFVCQHHGTFYAWPQFRIDPAQCTDPTVNFSAPSSTSSSPLPTLCPQCQRPAWMVLPRTSVVIG